MKMRDTYDRVFRCEDFLKSLLNISSELEDAYNCPFGLAHFRNSDFYYIVKDRDDFEHDFYVNLYGKIDGVISCLQQHLSQLNKRLNFEEAVEQFNMLEGLDDPFGDFPLEDAVNE